MTLFPRPVSFQAPHSNFEIVVLSDKNGPSGIALDPRSTNKPVKWDKSWCVPKRGAKTTGLSLNVRKCIALLATARTTNDPVDVSFELKSASMSFAFYLDLNQQQSIVRAYQVRGPHGSKRPKTSRRLVPVILATSRRSITGSNRIVDKQYSEVGAKIRCIPLQRTIDLLLTARELNAAEVRALSA